MWLLVFKCFLNPYQMNYGLTLISANIGNGYLSINCTLFSGKKTSMAFPFWYAFIGCDTVSSFVGRGKKTAWDALNQRPDFTECFIKLCDDPFLDDEDIKVLQEYVIMLYDEKSSQQLVNECRRELFTKKARQIENCPSSLNAFIQLILRTMLQSR